MPWSSPQYPAGTSPPDVTPIQPSAGVPWARNPLDAARSAFAARTPDAAYPDGYLGNSMSRRDRLFDTPLRDRNIGDRWNPADGQRGVHRAAAVPGEDYLWPVEFGLMSGLENQMTGQRFVPAGMTMFDEAHVNQTQSDDKAALRSLAPRWSTGGPGAGVPVQTSMGAIAP